MLLVEEDGRLFMIQTDGKTLWKNLGPNGYRVEDLVPKAAATAECRITGHRWYYQFDFETGQHTSKVCTRCRHIEVSEATKRKDVLIDVNHVTRVLEVIARICHKLPKGLLRSPLHRCHRANRLESFLGNFQYM